MKKKKMNKETKKYVSVIIVVAIIGISTMFVLGGGFNIFAEPAILDSSFEGAGRIAVSRINEWEAQSITIQQIDTLTAVYLKLSRDAGLNGVLQVHFRNTLDGAPFWSMTVLMSQVNPEKYSPSWVYVPVLNKPVVPGQKIYVIMQLQPTSEGKLYYWSAGRTTDGYTGGNEYFKGPSTNNQWVANYNPDTGYPYVDHSFKVYGITSNNPPTTPTKPSGPTQVQVGGIHYYTTSATDPDGDAIEYRYDWGEGESAWGGATRVHQWNSPGSFSVRAKARDSKGLESDWSQSLLVTVTSTPPSNNPPTMPTVTGPTTLQVGESGSWTARSTDSDGDTIRYVWTIDGTTKRTSGYYQSGVSDSFPYSFGAPGSYSLGVRAVDSRGASGEWRTQSIQVSSVGQNVQFSVVDSQTDSGIDGAKLTSGAIILTTDSYGLASSTLSPGPYTFSITKNGYSDGSISFTVASIPVVKTIYLVPIETPDEPEQPDEGDEEPQEGEYALTVRVYDKSTNNPIIDAIVRIQTDVKFTDSTGEAVFSKLPATYSISISKIGYDTEQTTTEIRTTEKTVFVYLTQASSGDGEIPEDEVEGVPGFELMSLCIALGIAFILFRRRKKQ